MCPGAVGHEPVITESGLEAVLRRDRFVVLAALALIAALAWIYLGWFDAGMGTPAMHAGMAVRDQSSAPAWGPWSGADFLVMFLMWAIMMIGMMTPSVAPMLLIYARVARQARAQGMPYAPTAWFASGYLLAWTGFSLLATLLQWGLEYASLLTPMMASANPLLAGGLLVAAGVYQWTPLKHACLANCRSPLVFIQRHGGFRGSRAGSLAIGMRHGLYCIGCCWGLMLLLFVVGVMNLLWIALIAVLILAEKLVPPGWHLARASGILLVMAGIAMVAGLF